MNQETTRRTHYSATHYSATHYSAFKQSRSLENIRACILWVQFFIFIRFTLAFGCAYQLQYGSLFARVVKWHTRMLEVHVGKPVGVRVPPRAPLSFSDSLSITSNCPKSAFQA